MKYAVLLFDDPGRWAERQRDRAATLARRTWQSRKSPRARRRAAPAGRDGEDASRCKDGETIVTDGPFTETKEILSGFYLIDADSEARALEIAWTIPTVSRMGGAVEVRPIVER